MDWVWLRCVVITYALNHFIYKQSNEKLSNEATCLKPFMKATNSLLFILGVLFATSCNQTDDSKPVPTASVYYPPSSADQWETINAADLGWDVAKLNEAIEYVGDNNSTAFIILYKGRIVTEKYWRSWTPVTSSRIFSASKSMIALLTGLAQEQGKLMMTNKASDYLGTGWSETTLEQENQITVQHLLTMTSGLTEDLTYQAAPGTEWYYNTPAYQQLTTVLEKAYGMSLTDLTNAQLWRKIGMQNSFWDTDPTGVTMSCSARDMARFGLLTMAGGKWNGETIMTDAAYWQAMLNSAQNLNPSYGYLWWLNGKSAYVSPSGSDPQAATLTPGFLIPSAPADLVAALGANDKKIYVSQSKDIVVIRHGGKSNAASALAMSAFDEQIWARLMLAIK